MSRRARQIFVSDTEVHADGQLAGEPKRARPEPAAPLPRGEIFKFELRDAARARAMGEELTPRQREVVKRWLMDRADPVPGEPEPAPARTKTGSVLPQISASRQIPDNSDTWSELVQDGQVVPPPYDPWLLISAVEESDVLGPACETMGHNIAGYGYDLDALFDRVDEEGNQLDEPPEAKTERETLELFLASCSTLGLVEALYRVDYDCETTGNGYLEILRDALGRVAGLEPAPSYTMRLGRLSSSILVDVPFRHPTTGQLVTLRRWRRFRLFVQIRDQLVRYFKEYGDPRFVNCETGEARDTSWGRGQDGGLLDATEVFHVRQYRSYTPYGVPRWVGAIPQVRAGRSASELVCDWFDYAPIGAKIALLAGGTWKQESLDQALDTIDDMARGAENAWGIVTLEADPLSMKDPLDETRDAPPRIQFEDLAFVLPEGLYKGPECLISMARERVAAMFRLPPIYFGRSDDYTRATSNTARASTEEQVFVPIRGSRWEAFFDGQLLPGLGVNYWRIKLRGANTTDDADLPLDALTGGGGTSPNALIAASNRLTGEDRPPIGEPWADRPLELTLALLARGLDPNLPLGELAAQVKEKEEAAAAEAKAQLEALNNAPDPAAQAGPPDAQAGPPAKGKPAKVEKSAGDALELLGHLRALRVAISHELADGQE